jgi:RNA polymerase sigma-70 factor (ECF subfamily)
MRASGDLPDDQAEVRDLVEASLRGDQQAFRQLVERKREFVFRTAYQQTGNADDARAVAQTVFIRVWQNLGKYDPSRRFDTWLHQVTVNAAIDHHRRRRRFARETSLDETFTGGAGAPGTATAQDELEARELQRILNELAGSLTEKQRAAFVLREIEGLSTAEVAEALGATESTVRNHVFAARRLLREALRARYPELVRGLREEAGTP